MDIRQLKYFVAIVEENNITKAAKRLNIAQPPLSYQLKLLEQTLGIDLFKRYGKKLELTLAGKTLYKRAVYLINQLNETVDEIQDIKNGIRGEISVGVGHLDLYRLPDKINNFRKRYPEVTFKILDRDTNNLVRLLESRKIEMAILNLPIVIDSSTVEMLRLGDIKYSLFVPKSWDVEESKHTITYKEIEQLPLVLSRREDGVGGTYEAIIEESKKHGVKLNIICECNNPHSAFTFVEAGIGATIMPNYIFNRFSKHNIRPLEIVGSSLSMESVVLWSKDRYISKIAEEFIQEFVSDQ
ncbi:LysR family transcriptional regulator [Priestia megaterium]|uniref:LysR family transcriptional regulator n=1 Tax=Priestia megaterium TaxID=1404 RepID=UPI002E233EB9|nr:LysR family transcriptional regulator [Priestia megaterium]